MRCASVETRLRALADGELDPAQSRAVLAHLEGCARCRQAHSRVLSVTALLAEQPVEEAPPHFSAGLQVRLARYRSGREVRLGARAAERSRQWRLGGLVATAALTAAICVFAFAPRMGAAEVARMAERSWSGIRNYGCEFVSRGVYRGEQRTFRQRQFYRKLEGGGEFRLDTAQDYQLSTFIQPDRVIHYLPGGDWEGQGPLVLIRPRHEGSGTLPFPFGVTGQNGGNVSIHQLIRQLSGNDDALVVGKEPVGGRECYRVRFTAVPPGGTRRDRYELWVDGESFLPRRVSWYRDDRNHIVTEALYLQVNFDVLPAGTFAFQVPDGACVVEGDVDPHVLALPFRPPRTARFAGDATGAAREEGWRRAASMPFPVLSPRWLPERFELIRVRGKSGRWVDMHWIRGAGGGSHHVLKLVQEEGGAEPAADLQYGMPFSLETRAGHVTGRLLSSARPYPHAYLTWKQGDTRLTLFGAGLSAEELARIARSMRPVGPSPEPRSLVARHGRSGESSGEPSTLPTATRAAAMEEPRVSPPGWDAAPADPLQPPMMPEMMDEDRRPSEPTR